MKTLYLIRFVFVDLVIVLLIVKQAQYNEITALYRDAVRIRQLHR